MVLVIALGIILIWFGASFLRKRHIRKREREIEMKPPIAWGPHQMQNQTGGYGDGVVEAGGARSKAAKSLGPLATPADNGGANGPKKGWLRKSRYVS